MSSIDLSSIKPGHLLKLSRRVQYLVRWLFFNKERVPFSTLLNSYLLPVSHFNKYADQVVESLNETESHFIVKIKGYSKPLYYTKPALVSNSHFHSVDYRLFQLRTVLAEQLAPYSWHMYQPLDIPEVQIQPDDIVIDCGAAEGIFTFLVHGKCKKVYAVEPSSLNVAALKLTFAGSENIEIMPVGLADKKEQLFLAEAGGSSLISDNTSGEQVEIDTIDHLFYDQNRPFTFLKADIEGFEYKMIKGAEKSIGKYKPKIALTTYHDPAHAKQIKEFLQSIDPNYRVELRGFSHFYWCPAMLYAWVE